eukprot:13783072-Alexandrium_andersonii.AAC.1
MHEQPLSIADVWPSCMMDFADGEGLGPLARCARFDPVLGNRSRLWVSSERLGEAANPGPVGEGLQGDEQSPIRRMGGTRTVMTINVTSLMQN